ncbi:MULTISPECIES: DegT/DnrJ/EryC1/StrS family aminotransferase [Butyricimonas]|uniref:DegT/DnrJ/EryC1/StrS family aminotransferase n=1 Tax=Butyricimonas TaxID=574697 RepID=UPI001D0977AC|nr:MULTISPECIES: DegT/DnrJ/EryC1/StrS family aminotransferase [Butyricimonas]MCB6973499.1 DegT/DnrJ/EryC1/StrS family aminotransferase [Butyricimonas synergistica]MCG4520397.1 DegT/DnrJ/EryC1/StrS family aminotransferase [Butyricimonas sp. DFI.6.44]
MNIAMVDLHGQYERIREEINHAIQEVLDSAAFINGPQVKQFEQHLAEYNQVEHAITCANGTDALQIALMTLGLQPGDEVIVPVHTYVATAEVIALLHLVPVFADCVADRFTIDVTRIEEKITPRTKAIVPVHLYGQCADMEPLMEIAKRHNLSVVEDAAQSIGAEYTFSDGRKLKSGCIGDIGTTSFFPSKNLGCYGDGGALFIRDARLAERARMIANHGQKIKYHHDIVGCNSRLDTLQAAILDVKLRYLREYTAARNRVADKYDEGLASVKGIILPARAANSTHAFHQYTIRVADKRRDELKTFLQSQGIPSMIYYPVPLHLQQAYLREGQGKGSYPVSEQLSEEVLSLPIHTEMKPEVQEYIIQQIHAFFNQ